MARAAGPVGAGNRVRAAGLELCGAVDGRVSHLAARRRTAGHCRCSCQCDGAAGRCCGCWVAVPAGSGRAKGCRDPDRASPGRDASAPGQGPGGCGGRTGLGHQLAPSTVGRSSWRRAPARTPGGPDGFPGVPGDGHRGGGLHPCRYRAAAAPPVRAVRHRPSRASGCEHRPSAGEQGPPGPWDEPLSAVAYPAKGPAGCGGGLLSRQQRTKSWMTGLVSAPGGQATPTLLGLTPVTGR